MSASHQPRKWQVVMALLPAMASLWLMAQPSSAAAPRSHLFMYDYLSDLGTRCDCYFTLEGVAPATDVIPPEFVPDMAPPYDPAENSAQTPREVLALLTRVMPADVVWQDKDMRAVIHIEDRSLRSIPGYPLERRVTLGPFSGNLYELGMLVNAQTRHAIQFPSIVEVNSPTGDGTTAVQLSLAPTTAREVLTQCVPLSIYQRILWTCVSVRRVPHPYAALRQFCQCMPGWGPPESMGDPPYPFSLGQAAYVCNFNDAAQHAAALQFLKQRMQHPDHWQVRWAMLYLGRRHVKDAIPDLIHYIDYQYTGSPIATERYPAYSALLQEGQAAVPTALAAIRTEAASLRLSLLVRVVLAADGTTRGRKEIQRDWVAVETSQRSRIHEAVVKALRGADGLSGHVISHPARATGQK